VVLAIDIISWICLITGGFLCIVGGIGVLRFPEFYSRTHAASITDTMGAGLILTGLMCQALAPIAHHGLEVLQSEGTNPLLLFVKIGLIGVFILLSSPTSGHALVKAAYAMGLSAEPPKEGGQDGTS
jgi:multicomponent Na+:H+ antiporter subunit G